MTLPRCVGSWGAAALAGMLLVAAPARAQEALPPLPPPSEPSPSVAPVPTPPAGVPSAPAPYENAVPPAGTPPPSRPDFKHAPAYALWLGGSLGVLAYSGGMYTLDATTTESTGGFIRPGLAVEGDVGARLAHRYIPYLTLELGLVGAGSRFDGSTTTTSASTSFLGAGFRYLMGDVDALSFAADLSFGWRKFEVSNASGTWSSAGLEILRLGFGVDVRLSTRVTVSPMLVLSGGTLTDTSGHIAFASNQSDGRTQPLYVGNGGIPPDARTTYFAIVVGCGAHVDLLGN